MFLENGTDIDFLNQLDVDIINLNLKKIFLKNKGFFSRLLYFKVFFLSFIPLLKYLKIKNQII